MKNLKNIFLYKLSLGVLSLIIFSLALSSCNDEEGVSGPPVILRVYKLDTIKRHKDSTVFGADLSTLLVINGKNLEGVTHAYFNESEASFNTNYNTNTELIIRVPAEAPAYSPDNNVIRLVTSKGEATYGFKVIARPSIISFDKSIYGKVEGPEITFKGKYLEDMISVIAYKEKESPIEIIKDSVICEIVSKSSDKLVVRVPLNKISRATFSFTNSSGTTWGTAVFVNSDVPKPTINSVDKLNYGAEGGRNLTFKGKNLDDMIKVIAYREKESPTEVVKDTVVCEIVSKSSSEIVVKIPQNKLSRVTLNFTNAGGTTKGTDVLVNTDEAFKIYQEDFITGFGNSSWGDALEIKTDAAYSGTKSAAKKYAKSQWHLAAFGWGWLPYDASYKYVTFAIKGASVNYSLYLGANSSSGDLGGNLEKNKIDVTAKVWNYYKIALKDIDFWSAGKNLQVIGFRIKGPDAQDEVFYFDDVMLIK